MYRRRAPKGELCNKVCMYVCMYVCIERLDMALCSDYIVRQNDNSRETITHECIIDQE